MEYIQGMGVKELLGWAVGVFGFLSIFFEVSKIKLNPISTALNWLGKKINADLNEKMDAQGERIEQLSQRIDDNEVGYIRWAILDFANSCMNGRRHTKEEFDHVIEQNDKYHKILEEKGLTNGKVDLAYDYIEEIYRKCQQDNDFL